MNIGIDIDDTIADTVDAMIKYADKYDVEVLGKKGTNGNMGLIQNRYYLKVLYGWTDEQKLDFFKKYYKNVLQECKIKLGVKETIQKLKREGHQIIFITARLDYIPNCNTEEITKAFLEENGIVYDALIVNAKEKLQVSKEKQIDLLIEDSYDTCKEFLENNIPTILMTTRMNSQIKDDTVTRVDSWKEIYETIKRIQNVKLV